MVIIEESAATLKRFLNMTLLNECATLMVMRLVLGFVMHRGRMSCSAAAGMIASQPIHRGQLTRFLARPRWQRDDFNQPLRESLLRRESQQGLFVFIVDGTMVSQTGRRTQNVYSTGNRKRRPRKGRRYNQRKIRRKNVHSFTFGLLITPSGTRIPFQVPHYTKEYCRKKGMVHRSTAESAADLIRELPLEDEADVIVLGDTAYDAHVVRSACADRGYRWIVPANAGRVYEGRRGQRPRLRDQLNHWKEWSLSTIRLRPSTGKYARYRRLSRHRVGPKTKPRIFYAHQEISELRNTGRVRLVFSTMKPDLKKATPGDVKILVTNATELNLTDIIDLYSLRWQIELFFKELKSTFHVGQYQFEQFAAVEAWMNSAITAVLFLEHLRVVRCKDRRLPATRRHWWQTQRLYGLSAAFRQECAASELHYLSNRLKTSGGIKKVKRLLKNATPHEYRT